MEETFNVAIGDDIFDINSIDVTPDETQFEVWKHGMLQFTIHHEISDQGNPKWRLVGNHNTSAIIQTTVEEIGQQIDSYYK